MEMRRVKELEPDQIMAHRFGTRSKVSNLERNARDSMKDEGNIGRGKRRDKYIR